MLIWITAPSAAIGTFVLFILLRAAPSEGNPIASVSDETTTLTSVEISETPNMKISDLPFANFISNPCTPGTSRNNDRNRTKVQRLMYSQAFYRYMSSYGTLYKQDSQKVVNESTIDDCDLLNLPSLPSTPNLQELREMDVETALKRIHTSLLLHSAHAYFVEQQYVSFSVGCSEASANRERNLAKGALILARKQKHMACMTQMTIEELGYTPNDTNSLLDEMFTNLRLCSRRALRDCQIMLSIINLLDVIANYSKLMLESSQTI